MNSIEVICEAWRLKRPDLLSDILASNFTWYENPYDDPIVDETQLVEMWTKDLEPQTAIAVDVDVLSEDKNVCVAHYTASFVRNNNLVELDGIFAVKNDEDGKLVEFHQWWVTK